MKRNIIKITEHGTITIPSETVWMSEAELVCLFGVIAPTVRAAIKAVCKSGILKVHEERNEYAMPYLKGCTCEKRKQASSFRWAIEWKYLNIKHKVY